MIGIQTAREGRSTWAWRTMNSRCSPWGKIEGFEDALVPEARPTFVHDLGFDLWNEVLGLIVDDGQQILFPFGEHADCDRG